MPGRTSKLVAVFELDAPISGADHWVRLTISLPGREGAFTKVWQLPTAQIGSNCLADVAAYVGDRVTEACIVSMGVQQQLI